MPRDNPFYYNLPTRPDDFLGRWPLVEEIVADLSRPRADSWAVIGGRRFGKSSVLKAVESRLLERLEGCEQGDRYVLPLVVDLKRCGTETEQHVYVCILRELCHALRRSRELEFDVSQTRLATVVDGEPEVLSFYQFEDTLDDLRTHFEKDCGSLRLALLLDEVEATTRFAWAETLFNQLRAMIYDGPLADTVKLVLTGSARVIQVRQEGSPLLNAVKIEHLESFSDTDLGALMVRGDAISDETRAAVLAQSGGHPFIAQYLLHHLWDNGLAAVTPAQAEQVARHMRQRRAADLDGWWKAIGESGQRAYTLLVSAGDWLDEATLLAGLRGTKPPFEPGLAALCYHGLAVRDQTGERYRLAGNLFRDWFLQNIEYVEPTEMDYERGLDGLRAQLEHTNRYLEFMTLEARLGENLRDERLYGSNETSRTERARVVNSLNKLALEVLGLSFNDLALGRVSAAGQTSARTLSLVGQLGVTPSSAGIKPPVQVLLQDLPFNELAWEQFEALCVALIEAQPITIDCHLYGVQGDDQEGIDIVATQRGADGEETWAYQCKRYKKYTPGELKEAAAKMSYPADFYVLMLSIPAMAALRQVADNQANLFLWDGKDIARKLKNYPAIIEDFFGSAWRKAFCG